MGLFSQRSDEIELMDDLDCSGQVVDQTLKELETINKWLGGNHVTVNGIKKLLKNRPKTNEPIKVVDLGCGSGDMLKRIAKWGRRNKVSMELTGIDANINIVEFAKRNTSDYPEIGYKAINIFGDEFKSMQYDIATCTLFTHHFSNDQLSKLLKVMLSQSRLGVVINDLHRHWFAYYSIKLLTRLFSKSEMVRNDAAVSVLRSFRKSDILEVMNSIGKSPRSLKWMWAFRWQLIIV